MWRYAAAAARRRMVKGELRKPIGRPREQTLPIRTAIAESGRKHSRPAPVARFQDLRRNTLRALPRRTERRKRELRPRFTPLPSNGIADGAPERIGHTTGLHREIPGFSIRRCHEDNTSTRYTAGNSHCRAGVAPVCSGPPPCTDRDGIAEEASGRERGAPRRSIIFIEE